MGYKGYLIIRFIRVVYLRTHSSSVSSTLCIQNDQGYQLLFKSELKELLKSLADKSLTGLLGLLGVRVPHNNFLFFLASAMLIVS